MKRLYDVRDYGAVCDGTLQTERLQAAVDACFLNGGGEVIVPDGVFVTATLRLRSNVTLRLLSGAVLQGSADWRDYDGFEKDALEPIAPFEDPSYAEQPLSRWSNALIRAFRAEHVRIIGEPGSVIDGVNCYDPAGEEGFRGPHAISFYRCSDVELSGYTVRNSANWGHILTWSRDVIIRNVTVLGGHDGIHLRSCDNVLIEDCDLHTGDDSIAGYNNLGVAVLRCRLNSSCSAFRFGGTDVLIDSCRIKGPGDYGHRWTMPKELKEKGSDTPPDARRNTLTGFLYFCCTPTEIREVPGRIVIQNCTFDGADRLFSLRFNRNLWCSNRSLRDITFRDCDVRNVCQPVELFSDAGEPLCFTMRNVTVSPRPGAEDQPLIVGSDFESCTLCGVEADGFKDPAVNVLSEKMPSQNCRVEIRDCPGVIVRRE